MKCHSPSFKAGGRLRRGAQTSKTFTQSEEVPAWWRQHQCLPGVFRTKHSDCEKGQAWPAHSAWPGSGQDRAPGIGGGGVQEPCPLAARALEPSLCGTIRFRGRYPGKASLVQLHGATQTKRDWCPSRAVSTLSADRGQQQGVKGAVTSL